jgi:biotin transport system substrate-specific component
MHQSHVADLTPARSQSIAVQALWIAGFSILTAVAAQIVIPHSPVPYTLQTFVVLLSGAMLGRRNGAVSQALYLALGMIGLPAFSGWGFGMARLLGPTGGYLLAFPVAAFVVGYLVREQRSFAWMLLSMFLGLAVIFSLGTLQLQFVYYHDWSLAFANGFLIFSWWDVVKLVSAAGIASRLSPKFRA